MIWQNYKLFKAFRLFRTVFLDYKWQVCAMAFLSFSSGILEGFGINAIIPLFSFVYDRQALPQDIVSKTIHQIFLYLNLDYSLKYLLVFISVLFMVKAIFLFLSQYITVRMVADYEKNLRSELFRLTLKSDWSYASRQKVGYLDQILITNVSSSASLFSHLSSFIFLAVNLLVYSLLVINISSLVAALSFIFGGAVYLVFRPWVYKTRRMSGEVVQEQKNLAHYLNEHIIGMKSVKSMFVGSEVFRRGLIYFNQLKDRRIRIDLLRHFTNDALQPIGVFFLIGIFAFFYKTQVFSLASFAVIVYAVNKVFANIQYFQSWLYALNAYVPYYLSVLNYREEARRYQEDDPGTKQFHFSRDLEFADVSFSYGYGSDKILSDVSFRVKKGEMIGVVGPSGAGKTTIVDLFLRLLRPERGQILIDGERISSIGLRDWRRNVGYVSQDIFLINDTILNNIRFYDDSISDGEIEAAARMANLNDFIERQPKRFGTEVGERGLRLSGGERQRIVLARILARRPQILILDEATSALDNESEIAIQKAINSLRGKITVIAIAHRLSTVVNFDKILVLERGRVVEEGSPLELLKDPGTYFSKVYNLKNVSQ